MLLEDIIPVLIHLSGNSLKGKTLLQKQIYFISIFLKEDFGYRPHYYGPYSPLVDTKLMKLKSLGFVNENIFYWGFDFEGFDKKTFEYSLTENGEKIVELFKETDNPDFKKIEDIYTKILKVEGAKNYLTLSIAAKLFYIRQISGSVLSEEQMIDEANGYGWKISPNSVLDGVKILKTLDLLSIRQN